MLVGQSRVVLLYNLYNIASEESPGSEKCQVTPGECKFTESATENIPLFLIVRVKWCGKSAPRRW